MKRPRTAFSITETLVVIAIISLLAALLAPAVQKARESMRIVQCRSYLSQLAKATMLYHDAYATMPAHLHLQVESSSTQSSVTVASIQSRLLPFLEQSAVYEMINWDAPIENSGRSLSQFDAIFATARSKRINVFLCPSDGNRSAFPAAVSYRGNVGEGPLWHQTAAFPDSANGPFAVVQGGGYSLPFSQIFDGLSQTVLWSERLIGSPSSEERISPRHAYLQPGIEALGIHTANDQLRVCAALGEAKAMGVFWAMGGSWLTSGQHYTLYTHAFSPNSGVIDCIAESYSTPLGTANARSMHPGVVNVVFADGSVKSISDAISLSIWRGIGTRNGGENLASADF